jgi:guanine nucleotide-binding protein subunit alpha
MAEDRQSFDTDHLVDWDDPEDPGVLLHARNDDMKRLWAHPTVQAILEKQSIRLQELAGLCVFLCISFSQPCSPNTAFWIP